MLVSFLLLGPAMALSLFIILVKSGRLRWAVRHQAVADTAVTIGISALALLGGVEAMPAGISGGLWFSLLLFLAGIGIKSRDAVRNGNSRGFSLFGWRVSREPKRDTGKRWYFG